MIKMTATKMGMELLSKLRTVLLSKQRTLRVAAEQAEHDAGMAK